MAEASRARLSTPEARAALSAGREAKIGWSEATKQTVRGWADAGLSQAEMARRLGVKAETLRSRANKYGIDLRGEVRALFDAGSDVLREHYPPGMDLGELHKLYCQARGEEIAFGTMRAHIHSLRLKRTNGPNGLGRPRAEQFRAERLELAPRVQAMLDGGASAAKIHKTLGVSKTRLHRMVNSGEVTRPAKQPKPPRIRVNRTKAPKPIKPPAPRKLPASYVRAPVEAPKPRPTYESVDAWLAAGNAITRCPTACASYTTATIPEADRLALTALYAEREANKIKRVGSAWRHK